MNVRYPDRSCTKCGNSIEQCECYERTRAQLEQKIEECVLAMSRSSLYTRIDPCICFDCHKQPGGYMVLDSLWDAVWPTHTADMAMMDERFKTMYPEAVIDYHLPSEQPHNLLCLPCLQKRAGRWLNLDDFTEAPVNNPIRFAHVLGQRDLLVTMAKNSEGING